MIFKSGMLKPELIVFFLTAYRKDKIKKKINSPPKKKKRKIILGY
jgi:hypothetical protein